MKLITPFNIGIFILIFTVLMVLTLSVWTPTTNTLIILLALLFTVDTLLLGLCIWLDFRK